MFLKIQTLFQASLAINTIHISFILFIIVKIVSILLREKKQFKMHTDGLATWMIG